MPRLGSGKVETRGLPPLIESPESFFERHEPHLSPDALGRFAARLRYYESQYPSDESETGSDDVAVSPYSDLKASWIERNERSKDEALGVVEKLRGPLLRKVKEEFWACGLDESSQDFVTATQTAEEALSEAHAALIDKAGRYELLLDCFSQRPDIIAEELAERMREAVAAASGQILNSEAMPEPPKSRRRRKEKDWVYSQWLESKARLIGNLVLPSRENILEDYFRSADGAFRRVLFGSRPMNLDHGFDSDSIEEIDSYQRRHYDFLGGYQVAVTPSEWAQNYLMGIINHMLYDPDSEIARRLSQADENNQRFTRGYRIRYSTNGTQAPKRPPKRQTVEDPNAYTVDTDELDADRLSAFLDIKDLIGSRLPKVSLIDRLQLIKVSYDVISELKIDFSKFELASNALRRRLVKQVIRRFHPDAGGDEQLCKAIIGLYDQLEAERMASVTSNA